jgi:hypothetical protein
MSDDTENLGDVSEDSEQSQYVDETYFKAARIVGGFQTLRSVIENLEVMPGDAHTARLRDVLKFTSQHALLSAWDYAKTFAPKEEDEE